MSSRVGTRTRGKKKKTTGTTRDDVSTPTSPRVQTLVASPPGRSKKKPTSTKSSDSKSRLMSEPSIIAALNPGPAPMASTKTKAMTFRRSKGPGSRRGSTQSGTGGGASETRMSSKSVSSSSHSSHHHHSMAGGGHARHVTHFTLGLKVGSGLGDCYLGLQKLENSLTRHCTLADDIRGFLTDLSGTGDMEGGGEGSLSRSKSSTTVPPVSLNAESLEECIYILNQFDKAQREVKSRMKALNTFVSNLHHSLEVMDEAHSSALEAGCMAIGGVTSATSGSGKKKPTVSTISEGAVGTEELMSRISDLEEKLATALAERDKANQTIDDKMKACLKMEKELLDRENDLDKEVIAIEEHSTVVRKQSERLKQEHESFKKEKERFHEMVKDHQQRVAQFEQREQSVSSLAEMTKKMQTEREKLEKERRKWKKLKKTLDEMGGGGETSDVTATTMRAVQASPTPGMMGATPGRGPVITYHQQVDLSHPIAGHSGYVAAPHGGHPHHGGAYGAPAAMMGAPYHDTGPMMIPMGTLDESAEYAYAESEYAETLVSDGMTDVGSVDSYTGME